MNKQTLHFTLGHAPPPKIPSLPLSHPAPLERYQTSPPPYPLSAPGNVASKPPPRPSTLPSPPLVVVRRHAGALGLHTDYCDYHQLNTLYQEAAAAAAAASSFTIQ
ncbi:hypothetical protein ACJQWK_07421 [Exserohilum turcicum]